MSDVPVEDERADQELARFFDQMLRIRRIEEEIARRYPEQEMRTPVHLYIGQEAVAVGVSGALKRGDKVLSGHRSHGHYLAKGGDLPAMISEIYGRATGCSGGKGGSQHLVDTECGFLGSAPILASTTAIGVGVAWALRRQDPDAVVVVYFGDAATEEGVFHESMSFASLHGLPVIFVCENNLYSTHASLNVRQPTRPLSNLAIAHAVPCIHADGNDVEAVLAAATQAVEHARHGKGPHMLVFDTYRQLEHVGPDSDVHLGYRSKDEVDSWIGRDPLVTLGNRLSSRVPSWDEHLDGVEKAMAVEIQEAFDFATSSPFPGADELLAGVFPDGSGDTQP